MILWMQLQGIDVHQGLHGYGKIHLLGIADSPDSDSWLQSMKLSVLYLSFQ